MRNIRLSHHCFLQTAQIIVSVGFMDTSWKPASRRSGWARRGSQGLMGGSVFDGARNSNKSLDNTTANNCLPWKMCTFGGTIITRRESDPLGLDGIPFSRTWFNWLIPLPEITPLNGNTTSSKMLAEQKVILSIPHPWQDQGQFYTPHAMTRSNTSRLSSCTTI